MSQEQGEPIIHKETVTETLPDGRIVCARELSAVGPVSTGISQLDISTGTRLKARVREKRTQH